ncbi:MAG TPA: hypothetical protein VE860_12380 [Chthoniobacterales bacterium]|nr:hypothetical protein [Chthoniobacterales bacterium]
MHSIHSMKAAATASIAALVFYSLTAKLYAHGFEGDRFFPPTITTDDPFAVDEFALPTVSVFNNPAQAGTPKTREIDISSEFDKEIFPKFALGIVANYTVLQPQGQTTRTGFDNLTLTAKYTLFENAPHEFIFSIGEEFDVGGTGSRLVGRESFSTLTPTIFFGKGLGDLPDALKFIKPFAVTGTLGYVIPGETVDPNALSWGIAVEYSLPYLQEHVQEVDWLRPFRNIIPLVEFSMNSPLNHGGGETTGTINPGLLWESRYFQLGAEAMIPVNRATGPNVGAIVQVWVFIDDIWPKIFGYPIFFGESK